MPVSRDDVVAALRPDELDYDAAAERLGADSAPILAELAGGDDLELASKAASLAGFLDAGVAREILVSAAAHPDPVVRVAAAASLLRQPALVPELAAQLLADTDIGVRKWTLQSLQVARPPGLKAQVEELAGAESVPALRELARQVANHLP
jgi:hypothetical protein